MNEEEIQEEMSDDFSYVGEIIGDKICLDGYFSIADLEKLKSYMDEYQGGSSMEKKTIEAILVARDTVIFTDKSDAKLSGIKGARVGAVVDMETMAIVGNNVDQDCPGGVCPIK